MAGCKPEYMPLLIAMTKAMAGPEFRRTLLSTHAWAPYCIINGPMARQLGIDTGQGQINEQANMVLGRFLNLAIMPKSLGTATAARIPMMTTTTINSIRVKPCFFIIELLVLKVLLLLINTDNIYVLF